MKTKYGPVLLVDDDPAFIFFQEEAINGCSQRPPVQVLHQRTNLLVGLATNPRPSLIHLDVHMPLVNEFTLLVRLQEQLRCKDIPGVILTELSDRPSVAKVYKEGPVITLSSLRALPHGRTESSCSAAFGEMTSQSPVPGVRPKAGSLSGS